MKTLKIVVYLWLPLLFGIIYLLDKLGISLDEIPNVIAEIMLFSVLVWPFAVIGVLMSGGMGENPSDEHSHYYLNQQ